MPAILVQGMPGSEVLTLLLSRWLDSLHGLQVAHHGVLHEPGGKELRAAPAV